MDLGGPRGPDAVHRAVSLAAGLRSRFRATGADWPFGDPLRAHGVGMEGYFWRFTDTARGRVLIALIGVNRGPDGPWATLGLGADDTQGGAFLATADEPGAWAAPDRVGAGCGTAFHGDDRRVAVDLGTQARLDVRLHDPVPWPRRALGGSSVFQCVPGLNQYWHPWLLGGRATGTAVVGGEEWRLDGVDVYAEKNWGREGFPEHWWWGQAHGFADRDACLAFAGGEVRAGPVRTTVTALVVRLPDGRTLRLGDPVVSPVRAQVGQESWRLRGRGLGWQVEVDGHAPVDRAHVLPVPLPSHGHSTAGALEHLPGTVRVRVRRHGRPVWSGESRLAGLENGGLARAEAELRRRGAPDGATSAPPRP